MSDWDSAGGFMNDSVADEPRQLTSSVSVAAGDEKTKSVAAVSISQIIKFTRPNEGLVLFGKKVYHCNLVALVHEIIDISPQKIHLLLDDYTNGGPLEVHYICGDAGTPDEDPSLSMFNDNPRPNQEVPTKALNQIRVGDYIRCAGVVKYSTDRPNLVAYNMRYVEDPNEVTMHTLEVIRDAMFYHKLQMGGSGGAAAPTGQQNQQFAHPNQPAARDTGIHQPQESFGKLSTRDKHLLQYLRSKANRPEGLTLEEIAQNFTVMNKRDIKESLEALSAEGLVWQGDSEDLWCAYVQ